MVVVVVVASASVQSDDYSEPVSGVPPDHTVSSRPTRARVWAQIAPSFTDNLHTNTERPCTPVLIYVFFHGETAIACGFVLCRNRDDGFGAGGSQQGLRAKQAQLELESDMQGREKVLGEENIGHNLLKKMGELVVVCLFGVVVVVVVVAVVVFASASVVVLLMLLLER